MYAYVIASFFFLVTLLISGSFLLIGVALLLVQRLPAFAQELADLACASELVGQHFGTVWS